MQRGEDLPAGGLREGIGMVGLFFLFFLEFLSLVKDLVGLFQEGGRIGNRRIFGGSNT